MKKEGGQNAFAFCHTLVFCTHNPLSCGKHTGTQPVAPAPVPAISRRVSPQRRKDPSILRSAGQVPDVLSQERFQRASSQGL